MRLEQLSGAKPSYGKAGHCHYAGVCLYTLPVTGYEEKPLADRSLTLR